MKICMLFTLKLHCVIFLLILYTQHFFFGVLSLLYFSVRINLRFSVNYLNLFFLYIWTFKKSWLSVEYCQMLFWIYIAFTWQIFSPGVFWPALAVISGSSYLSLELIPRFSGFLIHIILHLVICFCEAYPPVISWKRLCEM